MPEAAAGLQQFIDDVRRRWRRRVVLRAAAQACAVSAVPLLAVAVLWRVVDPGGAGVVLGVAAALALATAGVALVWRAVPPAPDHRRVARFVEEAAARDGVSFDDTVVSAVDALSAGRASPLTPALVAQAARRLDGFDPSRCIEGASLRRAGTALAAAAALLVAAFVLVRAPLSDAVQTVRLHLDPASIVLSVTPGDARVVVGSPLTLRATVRGPRGRAFERLSPILVVSAGDQQRSVPMTADGETFAFAFESVDRTFQYRVRLGRVESDPYTVTALNLPRVTRIDAHYEYPRFTGLAPRDEEEAGDLYAPKGTRVRLTVHADKPLAAGSLKLGTADAPLEMRVAGDTELVADLELATQDSYRLRLSDRDGLQADDDTEYFIRLVDDRPPDVRIVRPGGDQKITPLEEVTIEARADDDYGIASFELVYSTPGGTEKVVPFERVGGSAVARVASRQLHAEALGLQPGDVVAYHARARDVARGKAPTTATSDMFFLEVRPFNEEFVLAQSQAMAGQGDPQLESLIDAQKQIIAATWNLERRAAAGRSAEDLAALAAAQAELRGRAERMIRQASGRSFEPLPQQIGFQPRRRPAGAAAVATAAAAMGKAVGELQGQRTKTAIPHEMAALQGLMQAQAEIRRRQVAQQQANGGNGGAGRQGQDLSALFDKELQRQQRTNYETRAQVETRRDEPEQDSALDRIRELARRQEELARRQRELARASLAAAEHQRQLEQLQREQARLREQAEQLQRQMQSRAGQPANDGGASPSRSGRSSGESGQTSPQAGARQDSGAKSPGSQRSGLGRALEEMQRASERLENSSPDQAAASGSRAAEQLRRLEHEMAGGADRAAAAGDLRLEAQQIADAQRRVAAEAGRLEDEGRGAADALRRLAGEKERLAERVEALRQAAEGLAGQAADRASGSAAEARSGAPEASQAAGAAARALRDQRVGERMRESAQAMRDAAARRSSGERNDARGASAPANDGRRDGEAPDLAAGERQIAEAMDGVARQLGAAGNGELAQLSAQLDESRALRDRLDQLERQIRDAQAEAARTAGGEGRAGQPSGAAGEPGGQRLAELQRQYARELQRARELGQSGATRAANGDRGGATPEQHEWSTSAPGNEAFKQDFAAWDALRKDVDLALERYETAVSARIAKARAADRLSAGGSTRTPDAYDAAIARYYESLARSRK